MPELVPEVKTNGSKLAHIMYRKREFAVPPGMSRPQLIGTLWTSNGGNPNSVLTVRL